MRTGFVVTHHAAERFKERVAPGLTVISCLNECIALAKSAEPTRRRTKTGEEIWLATDGAPVQFVVKRDPKDGPVCVTVYGPEDRVEEEVLHG